MFLTRIRGLDMNRLLDFALKVVLVAEMVGIVALVAAMVGLVALVISAYWGGTLLLDPLTVVR